MKKTKPVVKETRNTPDVIQKRKDYASKLQGLGISYKKNCIFVNEAEFNV